MKEGKDLSLLTDDDVQIVAKEEYKRSKESGEFEKVKTDSDIKNIINVVSQNFQKQVQTL